MRDLRFSGGCKSIAVKPQPEPSGEIARVPRLGVGVQDNYGKVIIARSPGFAEVGTIRISRGDIDPARRECTIGALALVIAGHKREVGELRSTIVGDTMGCRKDKAPVNQSSRTCGNAVGCPETEPASRAKRIKPGHIGPRWTEFDTRGREGNVGFTVSHGSDFRLRCSRLPRPRRSGGHIPIWNDLYHVTEGATFRASPV